MGRSPNQIVGMIVRSNKAPCGRCGKLYRRLNQFLHCRRCSQAIARENRAKRK